MRTMVTRNRLAGWIGVMLAAVLAPLGCVDFDGYRLENGVAPSSGGATPSGGTRSSAGTSVSGPKATGGGGMGGDLLGTGGSLLGPGGRPASTGGTATGGTPTGGTATGGTTTGGTSAGGKATGGTATGGTTTGGGTNIGGLSAGGLGGTSGAGGALGGAGGNGGTTTCPDGGVAGGASTGGHAVGGITLPLDNRYQYGTFLGDVYVAVDSSGSTTATMQPNLMCAYGRVGQILNGPDDTPAYGTYWGMFLGWNLNQATSAGTTMPADLSAMSSITVAVSGPAPVGTSYRLNLDTRSGTTYSVNMLGNGGTYALTSFNSMPWDLANGVYFVPASMRVRSLELLIVPDVCAPHNFDFCVTTLTIQ
jgi:hypothetical protein